jgi:hypothetical protein
MGRSMLRHYKRKRRGAPAAGAPTFLDDRREGTHAVQ